jgi:hypothetical protein
MSATKPRKPFAVHRLYDADDAVALVRYDGDPDTFAALATKWLSDNDYPYTVQPPQPRLYRCNPDFTGEYGWLLGEPDHPGPGTFLGAIVKLGRRLSCAYCLMYPEHAEDCVTQMTAEQRAMIGWS